MSTTNKTKQKSISLILASVSIFCVILAMILTNFTDITDATISKNKQIIANKKPLIYPLAKNIQYFQLTATNSYALDVEISFSEEKDIEIKQKHESSNVDYVNIDFNKLAWQVKEDRLILNIDNALSVDGSYYYETLQIRLPKQLKEISIDNDLSSQDYQIINKTKPIDLTINSNQANFAGKFKQLTVKQTGSCNEYYYNNNDCFIFYDVQVDKLSMITPRRVVIEHNEKYKDNKEDQPILFNTLFDNGLSAKQINLNVPKNSNIKITNLALLNKIKWAEVEE